MRRRMAVSMEMLHHTCCTQTGTVRLGERCHQQACMSGNAVKYRHVAMPCSTALPQGATMQEGAQETLACWCCSLRQRTTQTPV